MAGGSKSHPKSHGWAHHDRSAFLLRRTKRSTCEDASCTTSKVQRSRERCVRKVLGTPGTNADRNDAWNETKVRPKGCVERAGNTHGMLVLGDARREIVAPKPVADETVAMHVPVENSEGRRTLLGRMWWAVGLALLASVSSSVGKVMQARASTTLPRFVVEKRVLERYIRCAPFVCGATIDVLGGLAMATAVSIAPVSVVQPIGACGIAVFALADARKLRATDGLAVLAALLGAACVGVSSEVDVVEGKKITQGTFRIAMMALMLTAGAAYRRRKLRKNIHVAWDGLHAGMCYGVSAGCARAGFLAADLLKRPVFAALGLLCSVALSASGAIGQAHALRDGGAAVGGTCVAVASVASSAMVGSIALGETLAKDVLHLAAKVVGLTLIVISTAVLSNSRQGKVPH